MRRILGIVGALASAAVVAAVVWRDNRRLGTRFVNRVVNPALLRRGLAGRGRSEIGTLEHVGRKSGIRRWTLVHPEPSADGFRIVVPLGVESAWAQNVLAAGHCRLQLHDTVHELDEPRLVSPAEVPGIPAIVRSLEEYLGFRYLVLHRFASAPGTLEPVVETGEPAAEAALPELVTAG